MTRKQSDKVINADELIRQLSVNQEECPGCPEPEFLPELINVLEDAPAVDVYGMNGWCKQIDHDDSISRAAAIDAIDEIESEIAEGCGFDYEKWRKHFCNLPPAQPETAERTAETAQNVSDEDLISRKAAMNRIDEALARVFVESHGCGESILRKLPSAQPERRWIPCSERLPEHGGRYLISVLDEVRRRTTVAPYQPRYKAWTMTGRMAYWKVIAWMPLPEPYREASE